MARRNLRNLIVFGPRGHGKTTLLRALQRRIPKSPLVHDPAPHPGRPASDFEQAATRHGDVVHHITDCASIEDWWRVVVSGEIAHEGAILVLSLTRDASTETEEQLRLLPVFGVKHLVVYLNHGDVIEDPAAIERAEAAIRALVARAGRREDVSIVRGAARPALEGDPRWEPSLIELAERMNLTPPRPRLRDLPLLFCIDSRERAASGLASVKGVLTRGRLVPSQEVAWIGAGTAPPTRVERITLGDEPVEDALPGDKVEVLLSASSDEAPWALHLAEPGTIEARRTLSGHVVGTVREHPIALHPEVEVRCVFERDERRARVVSASAWGSLRYGEHRDLELTLDAPMVFDSLTRFALRQGEERTAAGVVLASR